MQRLIIVHVQLLFFRVLPSNALVVNDEIPKAMAPTHSRENPVRLAWLVGLKAFETESSDMIAIRQEKKDHSRTLFTTPASMIKKKARAMKRLVVLYSDADNSSDNRDAFRIIR
jgi:hypothetical protein